MDSGIISGDLTAQDLVQVAVIDKLASIQEKTQDPGFLTGVVGLYIEHTPPLIEKLADSLNSRDQTTVARVAHRIKGSSLSVGAARLAAICQVLEKADIGEVEKASLEDAVRKLRDTYAATETRLCALTHITPTH